MDINHYRNRCLELRSKFGESAYSREELNQAWTIWKDASSEAFDEFVDRIMSWPVPLTLIVDLNDVKRLEEPRSVQRDLGAGPRKENAPEPYNGEWGPRLEKIGIKSFAELVDSPEKRQQFLSVFG
jgi:hypothetical protein